MESYLSYQARRSPEGGIALCSVASCQCTHLSVRRMLSSRPGAPGTGMRVYCSVFADE